MARANSLEKIMVDPLDVLTFLTHDPEVVQELVGARINLERLDEEIKKIDDETFQGEEATALIKARGIKPGNRRSLVLDLSIAEAIKIADSEGNFDVTAPQLLAGMLRQGRNIAAVAFKNAGMTEEQFAILARTGNNKQLS
jgi:hypothetical protein